MYSFYESAMDSVSLVITSSSISIWSNNSALTSISAYVMEWEKKSTNPRKGLIGKLISVAFDAWTTLHDTSTTQFPRDSQNNQIYFGNYT